MKSILIRFDPFRSFLTLCNPQNPGNFKVMVATGMEKGTVASSVVNVVDLESTSTNCSTVPPFPTKLYGTFGGLGFDSNPVVCGGFSTTYSNKCYSLKNGGWNPGFNLTEAKRYSASVTIPGKRIRILAVGERFRGNWERYFRFNFFLSIFT